MKIALWVALASALNPANSWLVRHVPTNAEPDLPGLALMSLVQGFAISFWIRHTALRSWKLGLRLAAVYFLIGTFLAQIETWLFLSVWNPKFSGTQVAVIATHHTVFVLLLSVLVAVSHRKPVASSAPEVVLHTGAQFWMRASLLAVMYAVIYWLAGFFIALPLAGDAFQKTYGELRVPDWMLLFQVLRGYVWVLTAVLLLRGFRGKPWQAYCAVGFVMVAAIDAGLLMKNPIFPDEMRIAHLAELFVSMMAFGVLSGYVLVRRAHFIAVIDKPTTAP